MHDNDESARIFLVKTTPENVALKAAYAKAFVKRVKLIREGSEVTADDVAEYLGVKLDTYYRYESKVAMPHYLISRFLKITSGDAAYLIGLNRRRNKSHLRPIK